MIFVDSNVPMYLVGSPHPNRDALESFLRCHPDEIYLTSAEVYQEVVHRFVAIDRREAIGDSFDLLDGLVDTVVDITRQDVERAREIAIRQRRFSARDALHIATMEQHGIERILSCDRDFELWPGLTLLPESR